MPSKTYNTTIVRDGSVCFIPVSFDPRAVFGKTRAPVKVTQAASFTHQREHVEAITEAKKPETRARRIQRAVQALKRQKLSSTRVSRRS